MSSDVVIVCKEDDDTIKIDEASMGMPFSEFGRWFCERFSGAPSVAEQMIGVSEHDYTRLVEADMVSIGYALATMDVDDTVDRDALLTYLWSRVGHHISVENW